MALTLTMLPAGEGDALWLRWGPPDDRRQMLVDLGVRATGRAFRERIQQLPIDARRFDLLVVTHVDTDHIYGVLSGLVDGEPIEGLSFDDVWFNGWTHLNGGKVEPVATRGQDGDSSETADFLGIDNLEPYGGVQGEQFGKWLHGQPWNRAFDGSAVLRADGEVSAPFDLAHGLRVTILGPTRARLQNLAPKWRKEVENALEAGTLSVDDVTPALVPDDFEPMGREQEEPDLRSVEDLEALADAHTNNDRAAPNGSSISLMVELDGKRLILSGDAFSEDLIEALETLDDQPLRIDAFKLPHHGSQNNVSIALVKAVRCKNWLVSTNGVKHKHPDPVAVARVIHHAAPERPVLWFNEPSEYNRWWDRDDWRELFGYETRFGSADDGLEVEI